MHYLPVNARPSAQLLYGAPQNVTGSRYTLHTGNSAPAPRPRGLLAEDEKRTSSVHRRLQIFCASLHLSLVVVHVVLLVVYVYHFEHAAAFDIDSFSTTWLPFIVTVISQAVGTAYLAVLMVFTQRLALRSDLFTRQTLTAIHDKNAAWLGLGNALASLWQQLELPAAVYGVTLITLYLIGIFALHITIPSLFHVVPFNATVSSSHPTVLANGPISQHTPLSLSYDLLVTSSNQELSNIGLLDNMVYDVIPGVPFAVGETAVNASIFDVQCESILPSRLEPPEAREFLPGDTTTSSALGDSGIIVTHLPIYPAVMTGWVDNTNACTNHYEACWSPMIVSSTVPVVDASGRMGPESESSTYWASVWPPLSQTWPTDVSELHVNHTVVQGNQLLQCNIQINDMKINVSAESRKPLSPPPFKPASSWSNQSLEWPTEQHVTYDPRVYLAQVTLKSSPPTMREPYKDWTWFPINATVNSSAVASATTPLTNNVTFLLDDQNVSVGSTLAPTTLDEFLMEDLGVVPVNDNKTSIALADLNLSLGKALAAVYWYSNSLNFTGQYSIPIGAFNDSLLQYPTSALGEALVTVFTTRVRLNLTLVPIIVGLTISTLLFGLSLVLTRAHSSSPHSRDAFAIDNAGILQLTWLLGNETHLSRARQPTSQVLREAGMFDIQMSERARDKMYQIRGKEDESSDSLC